MGKDQKLIPHPAGGGRPAPLGPARNKAELVAWLERTSARQVVVGVGDQATVFQVGQAFRSAFPSEPSFVEDYYVPVKNWRDYAWDWMTNIHHGLFYWHVFFKKVGQAHWAELHVGTLEESILGTEDW